MNNNEIRKCKKCGKDFIVVKKFQALGFNHFVDIVCPYCNQVVDSSLFFYVDTFRIDEGECGEGSDVCGGNVCGDGVVSCGGVDNEKKL